MKTTTVEHQLTENIIKKVTLRFFRQYYKFRLRYDDQPVTAKYDLEGVGGIIADGYYSFRKTDGRPFIATFEATSKTTRDEVIYKPQMRILMWDGLASACVFIFVLSALNYLYGYHDLDERTLLFRISLLIFSLCVFMILYYVIAKNFRRYRYIYAIEQFKKFHADEQWIAMAEDVFPNSDDKYFRELRHQCVFNGFGLLQVNEDLDTKILVTPSRQDIFLGKRQAMDFFPQDLPPVSAVAQPGGKKKSLLPGIFSDKDSILRFRKNYNMQIVVAIGSLFLTGLIMTREMQLKGFQQVGDEEFRTQIGISQSKGRAEDKAVMGDSALTMDTRNPDLDELNKSLWRDLTPDPPPAEKKPTPQISPEAPPPVRKREEPKDTTEIVINQMNGKSIAYDCARFYTFDSKTYIVEEGVYPSWPAAQRKLALLRNSGIESAALLLTCFSPGEKGLVVYLGMIYNSQEEASQYIESLTRIRQNVIKDVQQLKIRTLHPPAGVRQ